MLLVLFLITLLSRYLYAFLSQLDESNVVFVWGAV